MTKSGTDSAAGQLELDASSSVKKLRILVLSPWGLRGGYSGPVVLMNRLFQAISNAEGLHDVSVVYRSRGWHEEAAWASEAISLVDTRDGRFTRQAQLLWAWRAWKFVATQSRRFDVVHLQGAYFFNLVALIGAKRRLRTVVLPVLEGGDLRATGSIGSAIKRRLLQHVLRRTDLTLALSHGIEEELLALGVPKTAIAGIGNPVQISEYEIDRSQASPGASIRLGFVGKLGPVKQPHLILDALHLLQQDGRKAVAVFVGPFVDQTYESYFRERIKALNLDAHVSIIGFTDDVASHVKNDMDVFVLPSTEEGLPGALVEAMASGLPSIVTDVGAMGDVVRSSGGGTVVDGTGESIRAAVDAHMRDPSRWSKYSLAAAAFARATYSADTTASHYLTLVGGLDPR